VINIKRAWSWADPSLLCTRYEVSELVALQVQKRMTEYPFNAAACLLRRRQTQGSVDEKELLVLIPTDPSTNLIHCIYEVHSSTWRWRSSISIEVGHLTHQTLQNRHDNRATSLADRGIGVCEALDADAEEE
jgi:hypothetical protein